MVTTIASAPTVVSTTLANNLDKQLHPHPKIQPSNPTTTQTPVTLPESIKHPSKIANVPPPLQQVIQRSTSNNKISMRQDSSVSSDSFSQTSSPSYTTKTMETPLLPHISRALCNGKPGDRTVTRAAAVANVLARKRQSESEIKDLNGNGALTKSASTPASLQTIVRFHNGSNMSLHHRVSFFNKYIKTCYS